MITRFSLAIAHAPWMPGRAESYARLMGQLAAQVEKTKPHAAETFADKAPNHVWSGQMWGWAVSQDSVDWCVFLQDDAVIATNFWEMLDYWCSRPPPRTATWTAEVIGLQVAHPAAVACASEGIKWFTTNDALVGVGYAVKREGLAAFLAWRAELPSELREGITEDTLLGTWCAATGRKIYHPVPTIVDHDTSIQSAYGNDSHANRRSLVRWDTPPINEGRESYEIPHLGCFYASTPERVELCGGSVDLRNALEKDNGAQVVRRLTYARRARGPHTGAKVFVAVPNSGAIHPETCMSIAQLLRDETVDVGVAYEVADIAAASNDVVRARSRLVRDFLRTDSTHLFFVDSDVSFQPKVLRGMLAAGVDFVACPYPKREGADLIRVRGSDAMTPPEAAAYRYSLRPLPAGTLDVQSNGCAEVEAMPLGCALLSRAGVERMISAYAEYLTIDEPGGKVVWLFDLIRPLSEDYSYCQRWRALGESIWMYLGAGSPVDHHGLYAYRGALEAFGLKRG